MELARRVALWPPVVASAEIPCDMKEETRMGVRKFFRPRSLNIRETPFVYTDTSFSR